MRRLCDPGEFRTWLDAFLPDATAEPYDAVLDPARVASAPDDGVALHLVGLDLSKAWYMAGLASALDDHPYADALERSPERHAEPGVEQALTENYAGAHWLSSLLLYLLTRNEGGVAPD